ncbi:MAG: hypothetical protein GY711_31310 [bacterium]|nr:hypothetical protein [bacterium]
MYEVFRRVIAEYVHGEKLGSPSDDAQQWIQTTADLFYKQTPPFTPWSLDNHIRPDMGAIRRNAYYRMLGMDLNHAPAPDEQYIKAEEHNDDFVQTFERLLQEVWTGYRNRANATGTNPTDDSAIAFMCTTLRQMMQARRQGNKLSREELLAVVMLSWFHLTVDFNSPIVVSANASNSSAHERLRLLGEKVGLPAHSKSEHFFELSQPASRFLLRIDAGDFDDAANATLLYDESDAITYDVQDLITHWSMATGRDVKVTTVTTPA